MFRNFYARYKPFYKDNLILALPIVVSQLGHTMVNMADSIIVGHFAGTIQLAAVSLVNSIFMLILVLGLGISYGLTPLIAKMNGARNYDECGKLLSSSLIINVITGTLLYIFIHFCTKLNQLRIIRNTLPISFCSPICNICSDISFRIPNTACSCISNHSSK